MKNVLLIKLYKNNYFILILFNFLLVGSEGPVGPKGDKGERGSEAVAYEGPPGLPGQPGINI